MTLEQASILGVIEGLTEFLPISSTAHLIVAQKLMGIEVVNEFFTTVVQLGAILAVVVYFSAKICRLIAEGITYCRNPRQRSVPLLVWLKLATIPLLIAGFLIRDQIALLHNSLTVIAISSIGVGILLAIAEQIARRRHTHTKATPRELLLMGCWQVLALIPGASRSGTAIAGGLLSGLSFKAALEYSFLLSIPALLAAGAYELLKLQHTPLPTELLWVTLWGTIVAFGSALVAIHVLLVLVRRIGFLPFVIYRIAFGLWILLFFR